jgi:undecaprenyl-diphosphatase
VQVGRTLLTSIQSGDVRTGTEEWVSWLILLGSIPAGLLGLFLETPLKQLFASPIIACAFLVVNGSLLFASERMIRSREGGTCTPQDHRDRATRYPG